MLSTTNTLAPSLVPLVRRLVPWHADTTIRVRRLTDPFKSASDPFTGPSLRPW
jgi:hypothetical protein